MGNIPDILMRDNLDDYYAEKSKGEDGRHEASVGRFHQAILPGHVS